MNRITAIRARVWLIALATALGLTALSSWGMLALLEALDRQHSRAHLELMAEQALRLDPMPPPPQGIHWWRLGEHPPGLPAGLLEAVLDGGDHGVWEQGEQRYLWVRVDDPRQGVLMVAEARPSLTPWSLWRMHPGAALALLVPLLFIGLWGTHRLSSLLARLEQNRLALRHQALHDRLTGLPNRDLLLDRLEQARLKAQRERGRFALCLLDLDRFKDLNDTLGHRIGDEIIRQVAHRLRATLRRSDTLARIGGDAFAVILEGVDGKQARLVARKLIAVVEEAITLEDQDFYLSASCGIALYPQHGEDAATLLGHADTAMFSAKRSGHQILLYSPRLSRWDKNRLALIQDLRQAIETDGLSLYYQPKVDIRSGRVIGAEALARWEHPRLGPIPPATFISLAEHTGLIKPLTRWVIRRAFADLRTFRVHGHPIHVAVNLSALDLLDPQLHRHIAELAERHGIDPRQVTLELTETQVMSNPEQSRSALRRLQARGFHIALDDFGTGYASLENLRRLPVGEIKIDRSFVANILDDGDDAAIVRATVSLAAALGLDVVAEGVENDAVARLLQRYGCHVLQGYFIARPMSREALLRWLAAERPRLLALPAPA